MATIEKGSIRVPGVVYGLSTGEVPTFAVGAFIGVKDRIVCYSLRSSLEGYLFRGVPYFCIWAR